MNENTVSLQCRYIITDILKVSVGFTRQKSHMPLLVYDCFPIVTHLFVKENLYRVFRTMHNSYKTKTVFIFLEIT